MKSSEEKLRLLVISQYFYPEEFRINDLCSAWVTKGYDVTVVTGIPNYPKGRFFDGYGLFKKRQDAYQGVTIDDGVRLLKPLCYSDCIQLQQEPFCVLNDSGTIFEEAVILGFPAVNICYS